MNGLRYYRTLLAWRVNSWLGDKACGYRSISLSTCFPERGGGGGQFKNPGIKFMFSPVLANKAVSLKLTLSFQDIAGWREIRWCRHYIYLDGISWVHGIQAKTWCQGAVLAHLIQFYGMNLCCGCSLLGNQFPLARGNTPIKLEEYGLHLRLQDAHASDSFECTSSL